MKLHCFHCDEPISTETTGVVIRSKGSGIEYLCPGCNEGAPDPLVRLQKLMRDIDEAITALRGPDWRPKP